MCLTHITVDKTVTYSNFTSFIGTSGERCDRRNGEKKISGRSRSIEITTTKQITTVSAQGKMIII